MGSALAGIQSGRRCRTAPQERAGPAGCRLCDGNYRVREIAVWRGGLTMRCAVTHAFDVTCRQSRQITLRGTQVEKKEEASKDSRTLQKKWDRTKISTLLQGGTRRRHVFNSWFGTGRNSMRMNGRDGCIFSVPTQVPEELVAARITNDRSDGLQQGRSFPTLSGSSFGCGGRTIRAARSADSNRPRLDRRTPQISGKASSSSHGCRAVSGGKSAEMSQWRMAMTLDGITAGAGDFTFDGFLRDRIATNRLVHALRRREVAE